VERKKLESAKVEIFLEGEEDHRGGVGWKISEKVIRNHPNDQCQKYIKGDVELDIGKKSQQPRQEVHPPTIGTTTVSGK